MSTDDSTRTGTADRGAESRGDDGTARSLRVVHVESDEEFATLTDAYFRRSYPEIELVHADGVADALTAARSGVDCVVTDHRPPLTDAAEVATAVGRVDDGVPVVALSGALDDLDDVAGVDGTISKRHGLDALDALVRTVSRATATDGTEPSGSS
ncbi:response regulator [Halobaculum magnesiiphilum]|uniref:Response regulator n=1 Tax=Halobaculum magnesiiphilum TaxID=1017351 RepID=A0A8T8WBL9_9EURY|nr:response regulator [Halobaculum magnesiiphilum]QZP37225.1 response regulator [Halobaculum magnesiiphilum]